MKDIEVKDLQKKFISIAKQQGCVYEEDYHNLCYSITDSEVIGKINTWLVSSGLVLKKNKPATPRTRRASIELPTYAGESDIFDLYDLLALYHSGQGDPLYALQSRRNPEDVRPGELEAVETLLHEILANELSGGAEEKDVAVAEAWLPVIEALVSAGTAVEDTSVTADAIGDPQGTGSVEQQTEKTAIVPISDKYKKKVVDQVKHPNVNKLGSDGEKKVKNEFAENSYTKDELESNSLNVVIDTLRQCEDDFLPCWKKFKDKLVEYKNASIDVRAATFESMQRDLITEIERMEAPNPEALINAVEGAADINELRNLWNALYRGEFDNVVEEVKKTEPFREYLVLDPGEDIDLDLGAASSSKTNRPLSAFTAKAACNDAEFILHIASTQEEKARGLEVFSSIEKNEGMIFPFDHPQHVTFHMGSVKFPIDIIFLMDTPIGLKVAKIVHNVQPGAEDRWSCNDVAAVVEVRGTLCKEHNIKIGNLFEVRREK